MTEDDLKEFKVLEFIEVEPDKLVWDDTGTGTWMSGPPDPWSERFQRNVNRDCFGPESRAWPFIYLVWSADPWFRSTARRLILDPDRPNTK